MVFSAEIAGPALQLSTTRRVASTKKPKRILVTPLPNIRSMNFLLRTGVFCLCLACLAMAQPKPEKQVEAYFKALINNRLDKALEAFGAQPKFSPSQQAVLKEYKVVDPTPVGRCEDNLRELGKTLAGYNDLYSNYPASLEKLVPTSLSKMPHCPTAPKKLYKYQRRDEYYYELYCPTGHGRTPGFPMYSPIDGVIPNPNLKLLTFYKVMGVREESGLTKVRVIGTTPQGDFDRDFVFTPSGGFVAGDFSNEVKRIMLAMTKTSVPRATKLDPASLLLGVAVFNDQELIRAAHCKLLQESLYYKILGVQTRLGEKSFDKVVQHIDDIPKCPTSKQPIRVKKLENGKTRIYCSGSSHTNAGLEPNQPSREF